MSERNPSFSLTMPNLQIAWDSTSMGLLKECPRKYYYSICLGWQPRETSVHLTFGLLYHSAHEFYARCRSQGDSHAFALRQTIRKALQDTWNKDLSRPWSSDDKYKNRYTLIRTLVWYFEQYPDDPISTVQLHNGKPAVELSFRYETSYTAADGQKFLLCGHLDRLGEFGGGIWIIDHKSTKSALSDYYFSQWTPNNQMSTYSFSGKVIYNIPIQGVIIDAAQILVTGSRFHRGFAPRNEDQLSEWYEELGYYFSMASSYAQNGFWPMNDKACGNFGGCPFQPICARSQKVRETWLRASYKQRTWNPLEIRGDI